MHIPGSQARSISGRTCGQRFLVFRNSKSLEKKTTLFYKFLPKKTGGTEQGRSRSIATGISLGLGARLHGDCFGARVLLRRTARNDGASNRVYADDKQGTHGAAART
jgi:hypothetical protein